MVEHSRFKEMPSPSPHSPLCVRIICSRYPLISYPSAENDINGLPDHLSELEPKSGTLFSYYGPLLNAPAICSVFASSTNPASSCMAVHVTGLFGDDAQGKEGFPARLYLPPIWCMPGCVCVAPRYYCITSVASSGWNHQHRTPRNPARFSICLVDWFLSFTFI